MICFGLFNFIWGGEGYSLQDIAPLGVPLPLKINENTSILLVTWPFAIIPNKMFVQH